jgi:hypothetical protein
VSSPLFKLPEYDLALASFVSEAIQELMRRKDQFLGAIKTVESPQIPTVQNTMPSGEIVENKPMRVAMPFAVDFRDAIAGNSDSLLVSIDTAAEEGLKVVMPQIFSYMGRLSEAAGTATNAGGQKISHRLLRETFEKAQIEFDENDQPKMQTLVMHPDTAKELKQLPPPTEEEVQAWNEMIERKRCEYNDHRRHRKLS